MASVMQVVRQMIIMFPSVLKTHENLLNTGEGRRTGERERWRKSLTKGRENKIRVKKFQGRENVGTGQIE